MGPREDAHPGTDRRIAVILGVIVCVGVALRLYDLGGKALWIDEFKSLHHARSIVDVGTFLNAKTGDAHPPLYFLLLKWWMMLGEGEFHYRLLSVIFGSLVIPATYLLGRQFFDTRTCMVAALLVSLSPFLLLYDREVRMYPLLVLLTIMSQVYFLKALRENQTRYWVGFSLFAILSLYTHYHAFFVLASMGLFFFLRFPAYRSVWREALASSIVIAASFLLWLPGFLYHWDRFSVYIPRDLFPSVWGDWVKPAYLFYALGLGQTVLPWSVGVVIPGAVLFAFLFFSGIRSLESRREPLLFCLLFLFFPLLLAMVKSTFMPRYLVFVAPIFYLIIAQGISRLANGRVQTAAILALVSILVVPLRNYYTNREFHILAHVEPSKEVGQYLKDHVQAGDSVINLGAGAGRAVAYYWGAQGNLYYDVIASDQPPTHVSQRLEELKATKSLTKRVWVIVANPLTKRHAEDGLRWMNDNYGLVLQEKFGRDPDYARKTRWFKKDFYEYRATVYLYDLSESRTAAEIRTDISVAVTGGSR